MIELNLKEYIVQLRNLKIRLSWLEKELNYKLTRDNIDHPEVKRQILREPNWGKKSYEQLENYLKAN